MPTLYISHGGGPCFFMEWNMGPVDTWKKMERWFSEVASTLPEKPKAIIVVSAHWEEPRFKVYHHAHPALLYDYYGFPEHTYHIEYPAPGSPELATEISGLLSAAGIEADREEKRGFDHGVFVPLKVMFPGADIPIVQVSLKTGLDPRQHIDAGRALAPLRDKGILIVGSGNSFHNLRAMMAGLSHADSDSFDQWLENACCGNPEKREPELSNWYKAPGARISHPREEHLLPLMVVAGAAEDSPGKLVFRDRIMGSLNSSFQFG